MTTPDLSRQLRSRCFAGLAASSGSLPTVAKPYGKTAQVGWWALFHRVCYELIQFDLTIDVALAQKLHCFGDFKSRLI